ncbi:hypothetical protein PFISCL1PPCAC_19971 [Pristionchus fissidentatus]|uniref:WD40 domain-containing protein n=1 Tax=Pristionchus fissidentatus TaxID=1538716 RepID=A0AAV5WFR7_9BILA|nr:hypothetical protein PFISCL1PPCAC_19971 [Pristionchus fissidentatus]
MENDRQEEVKMEILRRRVFELRGKNHFSLLSASLKWIVAVPMEKETPANYLYACSLPRDTVIQVEGHPHPISAISFARQDESKFASASSEGEIRVWKANDAGVVHLLASCHLHKSAVSYLTFHPTNDSLLLSFSPNERMIVCDWMMNKTSFAVSDDSSVSAWSLDSRFVYTASATQIQQLCSSSGRIIVSCQLVSNLAIPYKILPITTCTVLLLSEANGASQLTLHNSTSLQCVYTLIMLCSPRILPCYNSSLGLLTMMHKVDGSIECHELFDCSPYLRSCFSRRFVISSQCVSHDWTPVSGETERESAISSLACILPPSSLNEEEEVIRVLHSHSSSPTIYLTSLRNSSLVNRAEGSKGSKSLIEECDKKESSPPDDVSPPLNPPSSQFRLSSICDSESSDQLASPIKLNSFSDVTQADYRPTEGESNQATYDKGKKLKPTDGTVDQESRGETGGDCGESAVMQDKWSITSLADDTKKSIVSPPRYSSFEPTETSCSDIGNPFTTRESNGATHLVTVTMEDGDEEFFNGEDGGTGDGKESRTSYANVDRFILEETVANLEAMLRKSERERFGMQKRLGEMEQDIVSLRYELEWKDSRISELEGLLSAQ